MSIGLNSEEMVNIFMIAQQKRLELLQSQTAAAAANESPKFRQAIETVTENARKLFPDISNPEIITIASALFVQFLYALMDTVEKNNQELAKTIPHVEISE